MERTNRSEQYKNLSQEPRRRAVDVALRKSRREEAVGQKRRRGLPSAVAALHQNGGGAVDHEALRRLAADVDPASSDTVRVRADALAQIQRVLAGDDPALVQVLVEAGTIEAASRLLLDASSGELRPGALLVLGNVVLDGGGFAADRVLLALPALLRLCTDPFNAEVQELALWVLGNVAGAGVSFRDQLHSGGVSAALLDVIQSGPAPAVGLTALWTLSCMLRRRPSPADWFVQRGMLGVVARAAVTGTVPGGAPLEDGRAVLVQVEAAWVTAYLCAASPQAAADLLVSDIPAALVRAGMLGQAELRIPVLELMGHLLVQGPENAPALELSVPGFQEALAANLDPDVAPPVLSASAWLMSNLCAGSDADLLQMAEGGVLSRLGPVLRAGASFSIRREAILALRNAVLHGRQLAEVVASYELEAAVVRLLSELDVQVAEAALTVLEGTMAADPRSVTRTEEAGGIESLESLRNSDNPALWGRASRLIDRYYGEDFPVAERGGVYPAGQQQEEYPEWRRRQ